MPNASAGSSTPTEDRENENENEDDEEADDKGNEDLPILICCCRNIGRLVNWPVGATIKSVGSITIT